MRSLLFALTILASACSSSQPTAPSSPEALPTAATTSSGELPATRPATPKVTQYARIMRGEAPDDGAGFYIVLADEPITKDNCRPKPAITFGVEAYSVEQMMLDIPVGRGDDRAEVFVCPATGDCEKGDGVINIESYRGGVAVGDYEIASTSGDQLEGTFEAEWIECPLY